MELRNVKHGFDLVVGQVGVTVRKGEKYSKLPIGTIFELFECQSPHTGSCKDVGCKACGTGIMLGYWVGAWKDIPQGLLSLEHNIEARSKAVCERMLKEGYGSLEPDDTVTAVLYLRNTY